MILFLIAGMGIQMEESDVITGIRQVLNDDSFKINNPVTIEARRQAERLLEWCLIEANKEKLDSFTEHILQDFKGIIVSSATKSFHYNKDKMWRGFFSLRTSADFNKQWTDFLGNSDVQAKPVLYQHLTDVLFRMLIKKHFEILYSDQGSSSEITQQEGSALRYAAGYVCRHLRKKIERENSEIKEELILCLMKLTKERSSEDCGTDEDWIKMIDRGGLWHVKETTYQLFCAIEDEVRTRLQGVTSAATKSQDKAELIDDIIKSDDVQFYWLISTADFEEEDNDVTDVLLKKIVDLYFTMRGFSHVSAWMEKYKQSTKKSTQRSKSLRRDLHDNDNR